MARSIARSGMLVGVAALLTSSLALGYPEYARKTNSACIACHVNPAGGADLTTAGKAFKLDKKKTPAAISTGAAFQGADKCRGCHFAEHRSWKETPHAHSLEMLKAAEPKPIAEMAAKLKVELKGPAAENDACVVCHVTGFRLAGGFPAADSAKNAALGAVGCESCHGPGGKHVLAALAEKKKTINRSVTEKLCVQCHTPVISPKFDFEDAKKRGVHRLKSDG